MDQARASCVGIEDRVDPGSDDCTVVEFDELATLAGESFYYGLYRDLSEPIPEAFRSETLVNVLAIFRAGPTSGRVALSYRRSAAPRAWDNVFGVPEVIETALGSVIYLPAWGMGDGRFQYQYDEYWLWQPDRWAQLDTESWVATVNDLLAPGFSLDGVDKALLPGALTSMQYVGRVRRDGDCHNCATGGTVEVIFEWDDLGLSVSSIDQTGGIQ